MTHRAAALRPVPERLAAYAALYRDQFAFVWRSLRRLGVDERELSDGAQEVFLVVFRKLPELDLDSRLTTLLYAICLRVASDWRRRAHRHYELLGHQEQPAGCAPGEWVDATDLRALLGRALGAMPLEQRAVFVAFELEGMTGEEIAGALDVPVPTVHSRLRLAREKFRSVVAEQRAKHEITSRSAGGKS
jgi:RNA polymerase sigma-70 factor, ECF subfamily